MDLARLYDENPLMICDDVRLALARRALNATWEALQSARWSERQLAEVQERWEDMDLFERSGKVVRMQRAFDVAIIAELRKTNEFGGLGLSGGSSGSSGSSGNAGLLDELFDKLKEFYVVTLAIGSGGPPGLTTTSFSYFRLPMRPWIASTRQRRPGPWYPPCENSISSIRS